MSCTPRSSREIEFSTFDDTNDVTSSKFTLEKILWNFTIIHLVTVSHSKKTTSVSILNIFTSLLGSQDIHKQFLKLAQYKYINFVFSKHSTIYVLSHFVKFETYCGWTFSSQDSESFRQVDWNVLFFWYFRRVNWFCRPPYCFLGNKVLPKLQISRRVTERLFAIYVLVYSYLSKVLLLYSDPHSTLQIAVSTGGCKRDAAVREMRQYALYLTAHTRPVERKVRSILIYKRFIVYRYLLSCV